MSSRSRIVAALGAALLTAAAGFSVLAAQTEDNGDRRRALGGWLVEDVADDGGRAVRVSHAVGDVRVGYEFWLPAEANRIALGAVVEHFNCGVQGGAVERPDISLPVDQARTEIAQGLATCEVAAEDQRSPLVGFEQAYALAWSWLQEERANAASGTMISGAEEVNAMDVNLSVDDDATDASNTGMNDSGPY
jgi:hypothetical protein